MYYGIRDRRTWGRLSSDEEDEEWDGEAGKSEAGGGEAREGEAGEGEAGEGEAGRVKQGRERQEWRWGGTYQGNTEARLWRR